MLTKLRKLLFFEDSATNSFLQSLAEEKPERNVSRSRCRQIMSATKKAVFGKASLYLCQEEQPRYSSKYNVADKEVGGKGGGSMAAPSAFGRT